MVRSGSADASLPVDQASSDLRCNQTCCADIADKPCLPIAALRTSRSCHHRPAVCTLSSGFGTVSRRAWSSFLERGEKSLQTSWPAQRRRRSMVNPTDEVKFTHLSQSKESQRATWKDIVPRGQRRERALIGCLRFACGLCRTGVTPRLGLTNHSGLALSLFGIDHEQRYRMRLESVCSAVRLGT